VTTVVPKTMLAVEITAPGPPEVLVARELPVPRPGPGEVLVQIAAAGVNRPDVLQRQGNYQLPPGISPLPGLEFAGTVVAHGADVDEPAVGTRVCALVAGGGYAQYAIAPAPQCIPVPGCFSDVEAAAIPETFFTVWSNLFDIAKARRGERLLVHGGASGIGTTAIQLGVAFGLEVYATAGSEDKARRCEALGARRCIDYRNEDFVPALRDATGDGVDIVLDIIGGDYVARNLELLRIDGRLVQLGMLGAPDATISLGPVLRKRLWMTGSMLRPRPVAEKAAIARALHEHVWPLFETRTVAPVIARTFPLADAAGAHRMMEANAFVGKLVLEA
jgi:putative PIG3 family NAD(P)H quinone oxidoreductase